MQIYVTTENLISRVEELRVVPDLLRGELGNYFCYDAQGAMVPTKFESGKILASDISAGTRNDQLMFPTYSHDINIYGVESQFRDQTQWREFVEEICVIGKVYESHSFVFNGWDINNDNLVMNYHDFTYEDYTKALDTNLLLNYNLMNYKFNNDVEHIKTMSLIKSIYDGPNIDAPNSEDSFRQLIFEYPERIQDYSGSIESLERKQRNIFDFQHFGTATNKWGVPVSVMPFHYSANIQPIDHLSAFVHNDLEETNMSKFIMQALKNNNLFRFFEYVDPAGQYPERGADRFKTHDLTNIIINYNFTRFRENDDELFLHDESDLNCNHPSNRFVNVVNRVQFLENYRTRLKADSQDYHDICDCKPSKVFSVGYKIEKYYLNDQTIPVQTYYVSKHGDLNFRDTQLKYGDKYIYKFYHLVGVLGSYYSYSDLYFSEDSQEALTGADGSIMEFGDNDPTKKYRARMKVSVAPSFQVIEIPIGNRSVALSDRPTLPPEVVFYNESNKRNNIMILLKTPASELHVTDYEFQRISESDQATEERLMLSRDSIYGTVFSNEHFTGIYQIYRMDTPPKELSDFAGNFLVQIDQRAEILSKKLNSTATGGRYNYTLDYPNASFEDVILPHRKYYYLFRSMTYHGTPSNPSHIYEIELIEDSNDTRIVVNEYKIPEEKNYTYTKSFKRLMRITPNFEQLLFRNEFTAYDNSVLADIGILESKIFNGGTIGKTFKIRVTSKHTGKKMDINLRFKIKKSNF